MTNLPQELTAADTENFNFFITKMTTMKPSYVGTLHKISKDLLKPTGTRYIRREVYRLENKIVDNISLSECYSRERSLIQRVRKSFEDEDCPDSILYENIGDRQKPTTRRGIPLPPTPEPEKKLAEGIPRHVDREFSESSVESQKTPEPNYDESINSEFSIFKKPRRKVKDKDNPFPWLRENAEAQKEAAIREENKAKKKTDRGKSPARRLFLGDAYPKPSSGKFRASKDTFVDEFPPLPDSSGKVQTLYLVFH